MNVPPGLEAVLKIDPEIMHGELCFIGTRVPLTVLLDNLTEGMGLDEFVRQYPSVKREQVEAVMLWEHHKIKLASGFQLAS